MILYLVGIASQLTALGIEPPDAALAQRQADATVLRRGGLTFSRQNVHAYLRRFVLSDSQRRDALGWIAQLGEERFVDREKAGTAILKLGPATVGILRFHLPDASAERHRRILSCLEKLERHVDPVTLESAARWVAAHDGADAGELLWHMLGACPDVIVEEEVAQALLGLAAREEATRALLAAGDVSDLPAQRALFHFRRLHQLPPGKERAAAWEKLVRAAPCWSVCRAGTADSTLGSHAQARAASERFVSALRKGAHDQMAGCCQLPFSLAGRFALTSRSELHEFLTQTAAGLIAKGWTCHILEVLAWEIYGPSEDEARLLQAIPPRELRAVHLRAALAGDALEDTYLLVRVGPRPGLVGIGQRSK